MTSTSQKGFTIIELLIVIVVIGILSAVVLVSYNGIQNRAKAGAAESAARQGFTKIQQYFYFNDESFPTDLASAGLSDNNDTTFQYSVNNGVLPKTFCLTATVGEFSYYVSEEEGTPIAGACVGHINGGNASVTWSKVALAAESSYGITSDGKIYAWGAGFDRQLGDGTYSDTNVPIEITDSGALAGTTITQMSGGYSFMVALDSTGTVYAWGNNTNGRLGNNSGSTDLQYPTSISIYGALVGKTITQISAGGYHVLALASDGTVYSWGSNTYGQLGDGTTTQRNAAVAVSTSGALSGKTITRVAASYYSSTVVASDGTVYSWGRNSDGQLGDGTYGDSSVPVAISTSGALSGKTITQISAGSNHILALDSDGKVYAWGTNDNNELGIATDDWSDPIDISGSGELSGRTVTQISAGANGYHNIVLASNGRVYSWGANWNGAIGNGTTTHQETPGEVSVTGTLAGKTITQIAAGGSHSAAIASDGILHLWGYNAWGELGDGTNTDRLTPILLLPPS